MRQTLALDEKIGGVENVQTFALDEKIGGLSKWKEVKKMRLKQR